MAKNVCVKYIPLVTQGRYYRGGKDNNASFTA